MAIIIREGMTKRQIAAALKKLKPRARKRRELPDIRQFAGTIKLKEDSLMIQQRMRDEWN